jgi:DNA mismatch repair ATPase MutS
MLRINRNIEYFYKLSDFISNIDMLASFAKYSLINSTTKPAFDTFLKLENSVNPIFLDHEKKNFQIFNQEKLRYIANNIETDRISPFVILTGANMSGKSTFLRQLGIK